MFTHFRAQASGRPVAAMWVGEPRMTHRLNTLASLAMAFAFCGLLSAQPLESAAAAHDKLESVLWVQTAAEHDAAYLQAFATAHRMLDAALKNKKWTAAIEQQPGFERLPPAVILDLDETILDNSPEEAAGILRAHSIPGALWDEWVTQERAGALPGALDFTKYARAKGVEVFYVTNRDTKSKEATRRTLARGGFPLRDGVETIYCLGDMPGTGNDKGPRRAAIAKRYRVLLLLGDDLGDFLSAVRVEPEQRRRMMGSYASYWGERWIILPNPMYGSWVGSLYGYDAALNNGEQRQRMVKHLRSMDARTQGGIPR